MEGIRGAFQLDLGVFETIGITTILVAMSVSCRKVSIRATTCWEDVSVSVFVVASQLTCKVC